MQHTINSKTIRANGPTGYTGRICLSFSQKSYDGVISSVSNNGLQCITWLLQLDLILKAEKVPRSYSCKTQKQLTLHS